MYIQNPGACVLITHQGIGSDYVEKIYYLCVEKSKRLSTKDHRNLREKERERKGFLLSVEMIYNNKITRQHDRTRLLK